MKFSTNYINKANADDNDGDNGDNNNNNLIVSSCVEKVSYLVGFARIFSRLNSY